MLARGPGDAGAQQLGAGLIGRRRPRKLFLTADRFRSRGAAVVTAFFI
jgi:hypothetical protein